MEVLKKKEDFLGKIIPNQEINSLLDNVIISNENIHISSSDLISDIRPQRNQIEVITKSPSSFSAKLLIIADGKNSMIKKYGDFQFITHDFEQTALSITTKMNRKSQNIAYQYFTPDGPLALLPYSSINSSIVWSLKKDSNILKLDENKLQAEINNILGSVVNNFEIINLQKFNKAVVDKEEYLRILDILGFDTNADFASNTFTAPIEGLYQFNASLRIQALDSASSYYYMNIRTSNRDYQYIFDPDFGQDNDYYTMSVSCLADMDANDTADVILYQGSGTQQTDINTGTSFSGYLVA